MTVSAITESESAPPVEHAPILEGAAPSTPPGILKYTDNLTTFAALALSSVLGLAYLFGFIIVNGALSALQVVNQGLLEGRYLAAGLLFLCSSLLLMLAVSFLTVEISRRGTKLSRRLKAVGAPLLFIMVWFNVFMIVSVENSFPAVQKIILFGASIGFASAGITLSIVAGKRRIQSAVQGAKVDLSPIVLRVLAAQGSLVVVPVIFLGSIFAYAFSSTVYPVVSPAFGGGAVWMAKVTLRSATFAPQPGDLFSDPVVLIDQDDTFLKTVQCIGSTKKKELVRIYLPIADVSSIRLISVVPLPAQKKGEEHELLCKLLAREGNQYFDAGRDSRPTPALQRTADATAERQ